MGASADERRVSRSRHYPADSRARKAIKTSVTRVNLMQKTSWRFSSTLIPAPLGSALPTTPRS
jgi:hypothetical protein